MIYEYAALHARMKALKKDLLSKEELLELIKAKDNDEVAEMLLRTAYAPYIKKHNPGGHYRREYIERALRDSFMDIYFKARTFMPQRTASIVKDALKRFELENIKLILRSRGREDEFGLVKEDLIDLRHYSHIPFEELLKAETMEEVAEMLKNTPYGVILSRILKTTRKEEQMFAIEMGLDYAFFKELIYVTKKLPFPDQDIIHFYLGLECDMLNLLWIMRAKSSFNLTEEEIFTYTLPFGHFIRDVILRMLVKANNISEMAEILEGNPWQDVFLNRKELTASMEMDMKRKFYNSVIKSQLLKANPFSIAPFIETLTLKEVEVIDITTIVESKRYEIPLEEMRNYLITDISVEVESVGNI